MRLYRDARGSSLDRLKAINDPAKNPSRALITGASGGIGRVFAEALAKEGWHVTLVARNEAKTQEVARGIGPAAQVLLADLSQPAEIARVANHLREQSYQLLINNAGSGLHGGFTEVPVERLETILRLNCEAVVALAHAFLSGAKSGDALVNLSSTLGFGGFPYSAVYAASKAFILSLSESLWYEQKSRGVYVLGLCPGPTATSFHDAAGFPEGNRPSARITQQPEAVVVAALKALRQRKTPTLVTGGKNKAMLFVSGRFMSRRGAINLMGKFGSPKKNA